MKAPIWVQYVQAFYINVLKTILFYITCPAGLQQREGADGFWCELLAFWVVYSSTEKVKPSI